MSAAAQQKVQALGVYMNSDNEHLANAAQMCSLLLKGSMVSFQNHAQFCQDLAKQETTKPISVTTP